MGWGIRSKWIGPPGISGVGSIFLCSRYALKEIDLDGARSIVGN